MSATTDQNTPWICRPHVGMGLNPETVDSWTVKVSELRNDCDGKPVVVVDAGGFNMQTFECDPADVAAAFARLANRIADAALDSGAAQP